MNIKSAIAYTQKIGTTGALFQTSKKVEKEITSKIDKNIKQIIVEFGAGHGNLTKAALGKMHPESKMYAFEIHEEFCEELKKIDDDRLVVCKASAQNFKDFTGTQKIDVFISSIPFSYIGNDVLNEILRESFEALNDHGFFSQVLYSSFHLKKFKKHFSQCRTKIIFNLPLECIYHCEK